MQANEQMIAMILLSVNVFLPIIILIIIYNCLIRRQVGFKISVIQAIVPVFFGIITLLIAVAISVGFAIAISSYGIISAMFPYTPLLSFFNAFISAGLPEELSKLIMILILFKIFKPKNVHEHVLIGFAVGMGFTFFEEYLYGTVAQMILRFLFFPFHSVLASMMAENIGLAARNRKIGKRGNFGLYLKAFFIPVMVHTIYDAATVYNFALFTSDDILIEVGLIFALVVLIWTIIFLIRRIIRLYRLAPEYSHLLTN